MPSRRVALALATTAPLFLAAITAITAITGAGAATGCSHSYAAADSPADAAVDAPLSIDASAADDAAGPDDASDAPATPTFTELASGYSMLRAIAADDVRAYFTEEANGAVYAVPLDGGVVPTKVATSGAPTSIALSQDFVYWTDIPSATVNRIAKTGGAVTKTAPRTLPPAVVAVTAAHVFALAHAPSGLGFGEIVPYDLDLAPDPSGAITSIQNPFMIAAQEAAIYWTEGGPSDAVASAAVGTTSRTVVASDPDPQSIAADANNVVWTSVATGTVYASSASSGIRAIAMAEKGPSSIATDDSGVYWLTSDGLLRRKRLDQELPPATIASGFVAPKDIHVQGVALTSLYVVWLTEDGRVLRVTK